MNTHITDNSIDLIFTDPPYGIEGDTLDKHYARDESLVVPGYIDVPKEKYEEFSKNWITECARVLKPGGSMYVVSGYSGLSAIYKAFESTNLIEVNHLIAQYSFGVYTKTKWVSSHYHVLYYVKPPLKLKTFNTDCRYSDTKGSYNDRLSVQPLKRDHITGQLKNKNHLPEDFIEKFIHYSSNRGDVVLDPFMGGFSTGRVALRNGRRVIGFELNPHAFDAFLPTLSSII